MALLRVEKGLEVGVAVDCLRPLAVRERVGETRQCLDLLEKMNTGKLEEEYVLVDGGEDSVSLLKQLEGSLAMEKACIIGHSFGGATTVMALAQDSRWFEL